MASPSWLQRRPKLQGRIPKDLYDWVVGCRQPDESVSDVGMEILLFAKQQGFETNESLASLSVQLSVTSDGEPLSARQKKNLQLYVSPELHEWLLSLCGEEHSMSEVVASAVYFAKISGFEKSVGRRPVPKLPMPKRAPALPEPKSALTASETPKPVSPPQLVLVSQKRSSPSRSERPPKLEPPKRRPPELPAPERPDSRSEPPKRRPPELPAPERPDPRSEPPKRRPPELPKPVRRLPELLSSE